MKMKKRDEVEEEDEEGVPSLTMPVISTNPNSLPSNTVSSAGKTSVINITPIVEDSGSNSGILEFVGRAVTSNRTLSFRCCDKIIK